MGSDGEGERYINDDFLCLEWRGGGTSKYSLMPPPVLPFYSDPER